MPAAQGTRLGSSARTASLLSCSSVTATASTTAPLTSSSARAATASAPAPFRLFRRSPGCGDDVDDSDHVVIFRRSNINNQKLLLRPALPPDAMRGATRGAVASIPRRHIILCLRCRGAGAAALLLSLAPLAATWELGSSWEPAFATPCSLLQRRSSSTGIQHESASRARKLTSVGWKERLRSDTTGLSRLRMSNKDDSAEKVTDVTSPLLYQELREMLAVSGSTQAEDSLVPNEDLTAQQAISSVLHAMKASPKLGCRQGPDPQFPALPRVRALVSPRLMS